jgi:hypothetical protein
MVQPFDLVAPGGAANVWIVEVGRAADAGPFDAFVDAVTSAPVEVTRPGGAEGTARRVRYVSPSQGELVYSVTGGFRVGGTVVPVADHPRLSSPWGDVCHLGRYLELTEGESRLVIDFDKGAREVHA